MGLFGKRKPNVKALTKAGKVDGLVEATQYRDVFADGNGVHGGRWCADPRGSRPGAR